MSADYLVIATAAAAVWMTIGDSWGGRFKVQLSVFTCNLAIFG